MPLIAPIFRDERRLMQKAIHKGCRLRSLCGEGQRQLCVSVTRDGSNP
ncbi:IS630 transposase [Escherichia coli]|nr:IS630 transposase [Escherichia coli]